MFSDKNECNGGHNCAASAICINNEGSFGCSCPNGFNGDGYSGGTGCSGTCIFITIRHVERYLKMK